ncbi:MAG: glycosyltransferase [Planctomycetota bacterium]|nr:glycosyltransferase [Planctomycetota bacterium]
MLPQATPMLVFMGLGWLLGWILFWRVRHLPASVASAQSPAEGDEAVTIIIPARNEASSLPNLLGDLATTRPAGCRVVVVNDGSEDDTAAIAEGFDFVELLHASPLRDGWIGKTWACHTGAATVDDGVLIFLDADVRVHGDALARAVRYRAERGGLLTIWPYHRVEKPYEHTSSIFNIVSFAASGAASLLPPRRPRAGFGPLMITTREDYERVGGHEAVKGSVIEDFALTNRYSQAELRVTNLGGGKDVSFRMYPDGFRSLIEGWTKNFGSGAWAIGALRALALLIWLTVAVGVIKWGGGMATHAAPRVLYAMFAVQIFVMQRQVGSFSVLCALLYPLEILFLALVLLRSLWRTHVRKSVTWRGREVATRP